MRSGLYAGWIVVDLRLLTFLALLAVGIALLLLGLLVRRRAWHEYVTLFVAIASVIVIVGLLLLQTVLNYPVVVERDFFPLR
jgi:uncharacterized membrane protein